MADKDFFGKAASFDDALRKFEEALRESQEAARGRQPGRTPGRTPGQPPGQQQRQMNRNMPDQQLEQLPGRQQGQQQRQMNRNMPDQQLEQLPAHGQPERPPMGAANGRPSAPTGRPQLSGAGLAGEILRQVLGIPPDAGSWQGRDQQDGGPWQGQEQWQDQEGIGSEGFPEPVQPDSLTEGIGSGEGLDSTPSSDISSEFSSPTGLGGSTSLGSSSMQSGSAWWEDSASGSAVSAHPGALPPALAHLDRYPNPLVQGVIWSEVLGRPVSKRRGRGRHGF